MRSRARECPGFRWEYEVYDDRAMVAQLANFGRVQHIGALHVLESPSIHEDVVVHESVADRQRLSAQLVSPEGLPLGSVEQVVAVAELGRVEFGPELAVPVVRPCERSRASRVEITSHDEAIAQAGTKSIEGESQGRYDEAISPGMKARDRDPAQRWD